MTKEQLMNYKEFGEHTDFVKKADELNTSNDLYYYDKRGIRTTDINDCLDMIEWKGDVGYLEGCIVIEVHHIYGYVDTIEVPCEICVVRIRFFPSNSDLIRVSLSLWQQ